MNIMATSEIERLAPQLLEALGVIMDSTSTKELRAVANNFIDEFKETSPHCVECGFYLILREALPIVRHLGLVLIEHCIKYQWNGMNLTKKIFIKENLMSLLTSETRNLLEEPYYIKNGLAKNVVEIIKREWPQQWPSLLNELYTLSRIGENQAELVLHIFLVLAEDVVVLNNVHTQRRREIYQGLVANLDQLFPFFTELLVENANKYLALKTVDDLNRSLIASVHCQVAATALETLAEYVDWVPVSHLVSRDGLLLGMFCELLNDDKLKNPAVKCLLIITSRKGKSTERTPLLTLFDSPRLEFWLKAACSAQESSVSQEANYLFFKNVCQALFLLGSQLHMLYGSVPNLALPTNFQVYLKFVLQLTSHPSQMICSQAVVLWNSFMQNKLICQNLDFLACIHSLVEIVAPKLMKMGFPTRNDCLSCSYSKLDFDCDEDFLLFHSKLRADCVSLLRFTTSLKPEIPVHYSTNWLKELLNKPIDLGNSNDSDSYWTTRSPSILEWEALAICLESVISKASLLVLSQAFQANGIQLMKLLLSCSLEQLKDPLIVSSWLSCISALFPLVKHSSVDVQPVLDAVFKVVVFSTPRNESKRNRSKSVKNVRRHACCCLLKLCKLYPLSIASFFDQIYQHVKMISIDPEQLTQLEKCTLMESLIVIKNECNDYETQSLFIQDVLIPVHREWLSEDIKIMLSSVRNFVTYVGLNHSPVTPSPDDVYGINRSRIVGCLEFILAVIKRSTWPDDMATAQKNGFVEGNTKTGSVIFRNPSQNHLFPLYPSVFLLLRILNDLWKPENLALICPDYVTVMDMTETDKNNLLGVAIVNNSEIPAVKDPVERFKIFLTGVYDSCYCIIGKSGQSLGPNFYSVANLAKCLEFALCSNIELMPDHRLRSLIRNFIKPFLLSCPSDYFHTVIIPFLSAFCLQMDQKFHKIWSKRKDENVEEKDMESELRAENLEVIEDQLHRNLTREYLDIIIIMILSKSPPKSVELMEEDDVNPLIGSAESKLSELGQLIFSNKELYPCIILTVFDVLAWSDHTSCLKALPLCLPIIRQLIEDKNLGVDEASYLLKCLLLGLQKHGQHDAINILIGIAYKAYEAMMPIHPILCLVISQLTERPEIQNLNDILLCPKRSKVVGEKKKKEMFKSIVIGIVEKSAGEAFSRKAVIVNLPPTFKLPKAKTIASNDISLESMGLCTLFGLDKV